MFQNLKTDAELPFTVNSEECDSSSHHEWKKGSNVSKPRQMCFGHFASIKELYKINFNLMTCWGIQFLLSVYLLSLLWAGTVKES
jgi:hypothetical protein